MLPGLHVSPEQHPLQVAEHEVLTQVPPAHASWLPHARQSTPPRPQAASDAPVTQAPLASQQPGQLLGEQGSTHCPAWQDAPTQVAQAPPPVPQ
jgi:hypothetical protein